MSSTRSSSNLWGNTNNIDISNSGARLLMSHPISGFSGGVMSIPLGGTYNGDGVTAGDVIRYDTDPDSSSYQKFTKAKGDVSEHAEVVGVIESMQGDSGFEVVNVVLSGQINFPTARFATADYQPSSRIGGASGGNDVYFLSGVTAGGISNLAPNVSGQIAKPILQVANDGVFNAHVVNYIGYQIGGNVAGQTEPTNVEGAISEVIDFDGSLDISATDDNWHDLSEVTWLPYDSSHDSYKDRTYVGFCDGYLAGGIYGREDDVVVSSTPSTTMTNKTIMQKNDKGKVVWRGVVTAVNRVTSTITVQSAVIDSNNYSVGPDVNKTVYHNNTQYTPSSVTKMAFRLPLISDTTSMSFTDMYGNSTTKSKKLVIYTGGDMREAAVTIADNINISSITATGTISAKTTDGATIADLANHVQSLTTDVRTANDKLNLTSTVSAVTP
jgi:hypothetical protein